MSQKLTPELANKVIRADLKNIIDKVGAGKPLSSVERNLFDGLRLTTEDIGKKRQLALLGKWSNGKRLNDAELLEIADLLPEGSIQEPEPEVEPVKKRGRNGYYHTYQQLAEMYGVGLRTVKRWKEVGDEKEDYCPLDEPEKLRCWWSRHMKKQCPDKILAAAINDVKAGVAEPELDPLEDEKKEPELKPRELAPVGDDEVGLEATLGRLRDTEVQAYRIMKEALEKGDDGKASLASRMWDKLTTQVRQVEKDARLEAEAMGLLIPKLYLEQKIIGLHSGIEKGVRGLYRSMCEVMKIPIDAKTEKQWNDECDKLFSRFQDSLLG